MLLRYLLLTGSSLLPLVWLLSAGLYQVEEGGTSGLACLLDHGETTSCWEPGFFALALALASAALALRCFGKAAGASPPLPRLLPPCSPFAWNVCWARRTVPRRLARTAAGHGGARMCSGNLGPVCSARVS